MSDRTSLQQLAARAEALHKSGKLTEAEGLYLQLLAAAPADFRWHHLLGILRARQGRNEEAVALIGAALRINPQAVEALLNHGKALNALGRSQDALESFNRALALRPDHPGALHSRGNALQALHRFTDAVADYDRALALKPDYAEALHNRSTALRHLGRFEEALADCEQGLGLCSRDAGILNNRGIALFELGRLEDALASYDAALVSRPDFADALNNRGNVLRELKRFDAALASFDKALAIGPDDAEVLYNRGKTLCEADRIAEGFAQFTRAAMRFGMPAAQNQAAHRASHDREQQAYTGRPTAPLHLEGGDRLEGPAIDPASDTAGISRQWQTAKPQIAVIDNLLSPEALAQLRRFCWGSTIWRRTYDDGYLGAVPEHGFACPLLAQIAEELRDSFPMIFRTHPLLYLWGFKYDSGLKGTAVHADQAAVNVNFWITPDDANLDPQSGGLVVWDKAAPLDWDFIKYNTAEGEIRDFLAREGAQAITVPYRANRAVIFDSDLFHETDRIAFKKGYENRRINITLLYGRRDSPDARDSAFAFPGQA